MRWRSAIGSEPSGKVRRGPDRSVRRRRVGGWQVSAQTMKAWVVEPPAPSTTGRCRSSSGRCPSRGRPGPDPGRRLRRLPDRPAPRRGRPAAPPAGRDPGPRGRRRRGRARARAPRGSRSATASACLARLHLRDLPLLSCGARRTCATDPASPAGTSTAGYAEYSVVDERRTPTALPEAFDDVEAAPLLCAGIIGYRALRRAELPPGGRLGIYGFGGSAHLTAQIALAEGARVHVMTRVGRGPALALAARRSERRRRRRRRRPSRSTRRSSSLRSATWSCRRSPRWTAAGPCADRGDPPERHPDDGLPGAPLRGAHRCAASPRTPGRTARSSWRSPPGCRLKVVSGALCVDRADEALRDLAHDRFSGAAVLVVD